MIPSRHRPAAYSRTLRRQRMAARRPGRPASVTESNDAHRQLR
jgi:hypothetical protein